MTAFVCAESVGRVFKILAADGRRDRRRGAEAAIGGDTITASFLVYENDHPNTDGAGVTKQWGAMDPSWAAFALAILVGFCEPPDLCSNTTAFAERSS